MESLIIRRYQFCDGVKLFGEREVVLGRPDTIGESFKNCMFYQAGWRIRLQRAVLWLQKESKHLFCNLFIGAKWQWIHPGSLLELRAVCSPQLWQEKRDISPTTTKKWFRHHHLSVNLEKNPGPRWKPQFVPKPLSAHLDLQQGFPGGPIVQNTPANERDVASIPESGSSPGEGNGNPF